MELLKKNSGKADYEVSIPRLCGRKIGSLSEKKAKDLKQQQAFIPEEFKSMIKFSSSVMYRTIQLNS